MVKCDPIHKPIYGSLLRVDEGNSFINCNDTSTKRYLRTGMKIEHQLEKVEVIDPVLCKGLPSEDAFKALDDLAATIAKKHKENGFA